jgi:hypothetical protein
MVTISSYIVCVCVVSVLCVCVCVCVCARAISRSHNCSSIMFTVKWAGCLTRRRPQPGGCPHANAPTMPRAEAPPTRQIST